MDPAGGLAPALVAVGGTAEQRRERMVLVTGEHERRPRLTGEDDDRRVVVFLRDAQMKGTLAVVASPPRTEGEAGVELERLAQIGLRELQARRVEDGPDVVLNALDVGARREVVQPIDLRAHACDRLPRPIPVLIVLARDDRAIAERILRRSLVIADQQGRGSGRRDGRVGGDVEAGGRDAGVEGKKQQRQTPSTPHRTFGPRGWAFVPGGGFFASEMD